MNKSIFNTLLTSFRRHDDRPQIPSVSHCRARYGCRLYYPGFAAQGATDRDGLLRLSGVSALDNWWSDSFVEFLEFPHRRTWHACTDRPTEETGCNRLLSLRAQPDVCGCPPYPDRAFPVVQEHLVDCIYSCCFSHRSLVRYPVRRT